MGRPVAAWASALQSLINQTINRSSHLAERLEELRSRRFSSPRSPIFLCQILSALNKRLCEHLVEFTSTENLAVDIEYARYEDLLDEAKAYANAVDQLYIHLGYIEAARVEANPPGIVSAIDRIAQEIDPSQSLLVCPSFRCRYEYHNLLSAKNLRSERYVPNIFDEEAFNGRQNFPVLLYPSVLGDDTLCHVLLAHELIHFIGEVTGSIFDSLSQRPMDTVEFTLGKDLMDEDLRDFFIEYVCDIGAVYLMGPAYLFALFEFLTTMASPTAKLQDHPPLLLRVRNILDTLDDYGQRLAPFSKKSEVAKRIEAHLSEFDAKTTLGTKRSGEQIVFDDRSLNIFKSLRPFLSKARKQITKVIPDHLQFRPTTALFSKYVKWVEEGVPPSAESIDGRPKALAFGDVINALWLYRVAYLQTPLVLKNPMLKTERATRLQDLSRLAELALRQNEPVRRYAEAQAME